jgi:hypothetical protein
MIKRNLFGAVAVIAVATGIQFGAAQAATVATTSSAIFFADVTGVTTFGYGSLPETPPPGVGSYTYQNPLVAGGITYLNTTPPTPGWALPTVDVNAPNYYSFAPYSSYYIVGSYVLNAPYNQLSITLPSAVTAFALDFGGFAGGATANFTLSNGFSDNVGPTLPAGSTEFLGFLSSDPFNTVTLTLPGGEDWAITDLSTGTTHILPTPLPAALPLFGVAAIGVAAWGRKRLARKTVA